MPLTEGVPAPGVAAPNQHGECVSPSFEQPTVLYFYPEDGTPGCRTEAAQFNAELDTYREAGVLVYGVSTDDVESHRRFADAQGIDFELLADPTGDLAAAFGVERQVNGATTRTTFILADDEVQAVYNGVDPDPGDQLPAQKICITEASDEFGWDAILHPESPHDSDSNPSDEAISN